MGLQSIFILNMETNYQTIIEQAYKSFNNREIDNVLSLMTEDVRWPNGWEGGYVNGYTEVRDYWVRQWKEINPVVTPVTITNINDTTVDVAVQQLIKDKQDNILFNGVVHHVYSFDNGKIKCMEIQSTE